MFFESFYPDIITRISKEIISNFFSGTPDFDFLPIASEIVYIQAKNNSSIEERSIESNW